MRQSREDSVRHEWSYPQDIFALYRSAEVHTHKARVPARLFVLAALPVLLAGLVCIVAKWWEKSGSVRPEKEAAAKAAPTLPEVARTRSGKLTAADWVAEYRPRVEGLAYTAPVYDDVTKPVRALYPAACLASKTRCGCYSDQGTRLDMPEALCRQIVERGFYVAWDVARGALGGAKAAEQRAELIKEEAVPIVPAGQFGGPGQSAGR